MQDVLIIAEAGVNHNGSLEMAKQMALAAKNAGADVVKYQTAVPELVVSKFAPKAEYQKAQTGDGESQLEMKRAVEAGYWHLYRYNPELKKQGKNPFILDSKEPTGDLRAFMRGEVRYASLETSFPQQAAELFDKAEADAKERLENYKRLARG